MTQLGMCVVVSSQMVSSAVFTRIMPHGVKIGILRANLHPCIVPNGRAQQIAVGQGKGPKQHGVRSWLVQPISWR